MPKVDAAVTTRELLEDTHGHEIQPAPSLSEHESAEFSHAPRRRSLFKSLLRDVSQMMPQACVADPSDEEPSPAVDRANSRLSKARRSLVERLMGGIPDAGQGATSLSSSERLMQVVDAAVENAHYTQVRFASDVATLPPPLRSRPIGISWPWCPRLPLAVAVCSFCRRAWRSEPSCGTIQRWRMHSTCGG